MDYILDSNVCIEIAAETLPAHSIAIIAEAAKNIIFYSVITRIEVLGFNGTDEIMKKHEDLFNNALGIELSENIVVRTIALRKLHSKIKLPDLIIAATALEYSLTLVTHNLNDFKSIEGLNIVDSHSL
jgi:predicted nucleic acid-binding protein